MTPKELALQYLEVFFHGGDLDSLYDIFAENLEFRGPFHQSRSAAEYIASLKADPPKGCSYEPIRIFESNDSVNVIYRFIKGDIATEMSQLFEIENGKVRRILLVFDSAAFN